MAVCCEPHNRYLSRLNSTESFFMSTQAALTWWMTGLPGSGKTTLAQALAGQLRGQGAAVCVLDGDELRAGVCGDLGFSEADRERNVTRVAHLARLLNAQGIHALVALVSPAAQARAAACEIVGAAAFREIYLSAPLSVCEARDPKGLYARSRAGQLNNMTGVQAGYDVPLAPHACIDSSQCSVQDAVLRLMASLLDKQPEAGSGD